jgi:hypothetical protein
MEDRRNRWLFGLVLTLLIPAVVAAESAPGADDLNLTLRRAALQEVIIAATPYRIDLGSSLLRENLTFSDARDLAFPGGKITFSIRCQGSPFPVDQVLKPVLSLRATGSSGYQVVVESLPLKIPGYGTVDLREVVEPVDIQSLLTQTVFLQGRPAQLDIRVRRIVIRPEEIEVGASLSLRSAPSRPAAPAVGSSHR